MRITTLAVGPLATNCYLWQPLPDEEIWLIDPGDEAVRILAILKHWPEKLKGILLTHGHFDHLSALAEIKQATGVPFYIHPADYSFLEHPEWAEIFNYPPLKLPTSPIFLSDNENLPCGKDRLTVIATPGHSPGSVCFLWRDILFSGDTLFAGSVGRTDLPGGSSELLTQSLEKLSNLPENLTVFPGHGPATTLGREKRINPFL